MIKKIYIDLDGVLAEFDKAVYEKTGILDLLGKDQSWRTVFGDLDFFLNIEPFWYAHDLVEKIKDFGCDVEILSSSGTNNSQIVACQKILWCARYFPRLPVNIVNKSSEKALFASSETLLIDDRCEKSIVPWVEAGGIGITHTCASRTIDELNKLFSPVKSTKINKIILG
jgi:hypothetical protein